MVNVTQAVLPVSGGVSDGRLSLRGLPLFYRTSFELPACDPWAVGNAMRAPGQPLLLWKGGDLSFAALGSATEGTFRGPERFKDADDWVAEVRSRFLPSSPELRLAGVPAFVGGFAFDGAMEPASEDPWRGWQPGLLRVPRLLLFRRGTTCGAVLTGRVAFGRSPRAEGGRVRDELEDALGSQGEFDQAMSGGWWECSAPGARTVWESTVCEALQGIQDASGPLEKVVLARRTSYRSEDAGEGVAAARRLRERFTGSTVFCFDEGRGRQFLGATPELLVRKRGQIATTMALAGSAEAGTNASALLASDKDRREQRYVTEAIRRRLEGLASSVEVDAVPSLRRHGNVVHLHTGLAATLQPSVSLLQTVGELHPTPAVAGSPRRESLAFIARHEPDERGWYAGPIGWLDQRGDGEFHVALRCGLLAGKRAWAFAGAGIVDGSDPSTEWGETENKLFAFRTALESEEADE